ncbi:MAG: hypothetical protein Q4E09_03870 [Eubacteriales bacterium]|nr:hypothetical protein [Eubacteriales bacterium]
MEAIFVAGNQEHNVYFDLESFKYMKSSEQYRHTERCNDTSFLEESRFVTRNSCERL